MIVVSDTTPIISMMKIRRLELLGRLYGQVIIPEVVYQELVANTVFQEESDIIRNCSFICVRKVRNQESVQLLRTVTGLDAGESEALILYSEQKADLLLMDERKGRGIARKMSAEHIGTMGILMNAYDRGLILPAEVEESIDTLLANNIRLGRKLCNMVLNYVGIAGKY